ncbi:hypothetical protein [Halorussus lipolyticus]|uniref:hypothetical protein n=1 Tax=Halorussus lipolyticus TaxID=3034024 RepID=UPI0023E85F18|nr:hypothetical protein [Halorussus sp. DT80]
MALGGDFRASAVGVGPNTFGTVDSADRDQPTGVSQVATLDTSRKEKADSDTKSDPSAEEVADRIRDRAEEVRRRELETALGRLRESGEVTPAERRILAVLSVRLADALVEEWATSVADESEVDPETALALVSE